MLKITADKKLKNNISKLLQYLKITNKISPKPNTNAKKSKYIWQEKHTCQVLNSIKVLSVVSTEL